MRIVYLGSHSILEHDELKLFHYEFEVTYDGIVKWSQQTAFGREYPR